MSLTQNFPADPIAFREHGAPRGSSRPNHAPSRRHWDLDGEQVQPAEFSEIIARIYECALNPEQWPAALDAIRQSCGFSSGSLSLLAQTDGQPISMVASSIAPEWLLRLTSHGPDLLAAFAGLAQWPITALDEPFVRSMARAVSTGTDDHFHRARAAPQGLDDTVVIGINLDTSIFGVVMFGLHNSKSAIGETELRTLRLFAPHIRRAVTLGRLMDKQAAAVWALEATIDGLRARVLLVDDTLRLIHANSAASTMLATGQPLGVANGKLRLADQAAMQALASAVRRAAERSGQAARAASIPVRTGSGSRHVVNILPLGQGKISSGHGRRATVALLIAPDASLLPREALSLLYDFTPAETRLFELIAEGKSQSQIAQELGIAPSTVKTHLLHVFAKTGVNRQADLVRLAAALALPV